jgi:hypothetical protein
MSGWFAMKRGIHEHPLFYRQPERLSVWAWILDNAAWKARRFNAGGVVITVERGQLCTTQEAICDATGVGRKVVRNLLAALEKERAVVIEKAGSGAKSKTLITVCNYEKYQSAKPDEGQEEGQRRAKEGPIKEQGNKDTIPLPSEEDASASQPIEVSVTSSAVWNAGKPFLASRGIANPGPIIGKWLQSHSPLEVLAALEAAQKSGTQDPVPYITQTLKGGPAHGQRTSKSAERLNAFIYGAD